MYLRKEQGGGQAKAAGLLSEGSYGTHSQKNGHSNMDKKKSLFNCFYLKLMREGKCMKKQYSVIGQT